MSIGLFIIIGLVLGLIVAAFVICDGHDWTMITWVFIIVAIFWPIFIVFAVIERFFNLVNRLGKD